MVSLQLIHNLFFQTGRVSLKIPGPVSPIWWPVLAKVKFASRVLFTILDAR